jgi:hypothetical protein
MLVLHLDPPHFQIIATPRVILKIKKMGGVPKFGSMI